MKTVEHVLKPFAFSHREKVANGRMRVLTRVRVSKSNFRKPCAQMATNHPCIKALIRPSGTFSRWEKGESRCHSYFYFESIPNQHCSQNNKNCGEDNYNPTQKLCCFMQSQCCFNCGRHIIRLRICNQLIPCHRLDVSYFVIGQRHIIMPPNDFLLCQTWRV